jgi:predicted metal-dependent hydrolase
MQQVPPQIHPEALKGLHLFNQSSFYDAHEYLEEAWRATPGDKREFYRALLQLSGGFFRLTQDRPSAARKFFDRALHWLEPFPADHLGMDVTGLRADLQALLKTLAAGISSTEIIARYYHPLNLPPQEAQ